MKFNYYTIDEIILNSTVYFLTWVSMFLRTGYSEIHTIYGGVNVEGRCIIFLILIIKLCYFLFGHWSYGTLEGFIYLWQP